MSLKFPISLVGKRLASWLGFGSSSRYLDGTEDYIDLGDSLDDVFAGAGKKFTVAAWIKYFKPTNDGEIYAIVTKDDFTNSKRQFNFTVYNDETRLGAGADGIVRVVVSNATNTVSRRWDTDSDYINENSWNHVAFTYDETKADDIMVTVYVNGNPVDITITDTSGSGLVIANTDAPLRIGSFSVGDPTPNPSQWFAKGNIADVRIYNADIGSNNLSQLAQGKDIQNNLVGHWLKDTNDVIDHSVNSNDGDNGFEPEFSTDSPNKNYGSSGLASRSFNGVDDIITLGDGPEFSFGDGTNDNPFSVSAWIKMVSADRFRILSKWGSGGAGSGIEWLFTTTNTNDLTLVLFDDSNGENQQRRFDNNGATGSMTQYENTWIHVVATYDGSGGTNAADGIKLYIDGTQKDDSDYSSGGTYTAMEDTSRAVQIGGEVSSSSYASGKIADVRLYNDVLTAGEVTNLFNGTDHTASLIGHWIGNSNDFNDMSVNSNNGTVGGSTYSADGPKP